MIDPLRYRSLREQLEFDEDNSPMQCWLCLRGEMITPAFFLCHECGKVGDFRPFCEPCFYEYHLTTRKGKEGHKPHPIVQGDPVTVQTLADGDRVTFAKVYDWVTLDYTLTADESNVAIEDTFLTKHPLTFQSGCSGPCVHLQLLGCTEIAAADIMGASDPYCAVYWKNDFVGATTTKYMTLNPKWMNQTFVLPLAPEFMAALVGDERSSMLFNAGAHLPKLRIELYDWDRLSKNDFLGQANVSDEEILNILRQVRRGERDEDDTLSFDLKPKLSRGRLGIRAATRGNKLYVHVMQAENVPKADPFSLSDPYCEVYWNDAKIGKTAHIDGTLDPVWDLEIFSIKVDPDGPNSIEQSTLRIVCLDWDAFGSDDVLGQIELTGWQITKLAERKLGDEDVGSDEGSFEEADMEKVFDFMRIFQEHEMDPVGLGKMVVGVPQDVKLQDQQNVCETAEAEPQKTQKPPKEKRKRETDDRGEEGGEREKESQNHPQAKDLEGLNMSSVSAKDEPRTGEIEERQESITKAEAGRVQTTVSKDHEGHIGEVRCDGEVDAISWTVKQNGSQRDEEQVSMDGVGMGQDNNKEPRNKSTSGEEDKLTPSQDRIGTSTLQIADPLTSGAEGFRGDGHENESSSKAAAEGDNVVEFDRRSDVKSVTKASGEEGEEEKAFESSARKKGELALDVAPGNEASNAPDLDVKKGGPQTQKALAPGETKIWKMGESRKRKSVLVRTRDANVQRFEEDRGVVVEYLDDGSSAWVETKMIPRLQIRFDTPHTRSFLQRLWDQRKKLFNLHKRVLNVKRGMKVLSGVAMTGSQMQWYQLELTDEQSGANFVRGTVDCRFLYHTRGSVLRGLDVAVSHMSLGERARVEVRPDYGFGEVYASRNVPPYATLVFIAQVTAIGHRNARWLIIRRALRDKAEDAFFHLRLHLRKVVSSYGFVRRITGLLGSLKRNKRTEKLEAWAGDDEEESMIGDRELAAAEGK